VKHVRCDNYNKIMLIILFLVHGVGQIQRGQGTHYFGWWYPYFYPRGLGVQKTKVNAISKVPSPTDVNQLKSFLKLVNYY
jgi:hypothetical protein